MEIQWKIDLHRQNLSTLVLKSPLIAEKGAVGTDGASLGAARFVLFFFC